MRKGGYSAAAWKVIPNERNTVELAHWLVSMHPPVGANIACVREFGNCTSCGRVVLFTSSCSRRCSRSESGGGQCMQPIHEVEHSGLILARRDTKLGWPVAASNNSARASSLTTRSHGSASMIQRGIRQIDPFQREVVARLRYIHAIVLAAPLFYSPRAAPQRRPLQATRPGRPLAAQGIESLNTARPRVASNLHRRDTQQSPREVLPRGAC